MSGLWTEQEAVPWLIASKLLETPVYATGVYPCLCEVPDPGAPDWKKERNQRTGDGPPVFCEPYRAKNGRWAGKITSRCPCWGRLRVDGLPEDCCAFHPDNPAYTATSAAGIAAAGETTHAAPNVAQRPVQTVEMPDEREPLDDIDTITGRYRRRFTPTEITCACPTPWDAVTGPNIGYHCVSCHQHFASYKVALHHQRSITDPCQDPRTQVNVDGLPVYRPTTDGPFIIWR